MIDVPLIRRQMMVLGVDGADVRSPLRPGESVDEIFGAPPHE